MLEIIHEIYIRELGKLEEEIRQFDESKLWNTTGTINNSAGNLCLHICGNLQHFVGAVLGNSGYVRNRDAEFALKGKSKDELLQEISITKKVIDNVLPSMMEEDLQKTYDQKFAGQDKTSGYVLVHLLQHLTYHLGQINYLRRVI